MLRGLLFVPGNVRRMLVKSCSVKLDALVPDLEDSVPVDKKGEARDLVTEMIPTLREALSASGGMLFPRVNAPSTTFIEDDIRAVATPLIDGISVGKIETAEEMRRIDSLLSQAEKKQNIPTPLGVIPWIETAKGVMNAHQICQATDRLAGVAFGLDDFTNDMLIPRTKFGTEANLARSMVAMAARAANVWALDSPWVEFKDVEGLQQDCNNARSLGFKGKFCIHPTNLDIVINSFQPSKAEVEKAQQVVEVFEAAVAEGRASTTLAGEMVDTPVYKRALQVFQAATDSPK